MSTTPPQRPTLYYVFDPLCGWCYGFSPVLQQVLAQYGASLNVQVVGGGLALGPNRRTMAELRQYVAGSIPRLEQLTGVRFGQPWLQLLNTNDTLRMDSEPPCRALGVVKQLAPDKAVPFAQRLLKAYFVEGNTFQSVDHFQPLCVDVGVDFPSFSAQYTAPGASALAEADFRLAAVLGATGFPTLVWQGADGQRRVIARGYMPFADLDPMLKALLQPAPR